jgi:putative peptide zinc metalloprotease protein
VSLQAPPVDARVVVHPFVEQPDGEYVIIGDPSRGCFLSVPAEAILLLRLLAAGATIGEAGAAYERAYGAPPDVDDFLRALADEGFVELQSTTVSPHSTVVPRASTRRYHFENFPVSVARRLCSLPVLAAIGALVGMAALVFERDQVSLTALLVLISVATLFAHEMAHLVAARAAGIPSRMGLGNRLWILVAETDMTGIWMASRRQRCVAFLAGPLFDMANVAVLVVLQFAANRGWLALDSTVLLLVRAWLFVGLTRLLWQLYFFVPTDFYYVIGTVSGCRSLMHDTQVYLLNHLARVVGRIRRIDQSGIPPAEMRVVRWFAAVWIGGRALAFGSLFAITLPVLAGYGVMLGSQAFRPVFEGPLLPLLGAALQIIGILVWVRSSFRQRRFSR